MRRFAKCSHTRHEHYQEQHRFEHWYRDNTVYLITARCTDRYRAFASESAKAIFWDRFTHYTAHHGFTPWITTLVDNHYHLERGLARALQLKAFLNDVSYPRYDRKRGRPPTAGDMPH